MATEQLDLGQKEIKCGKWIEGTAAAGYVWEMCPGEVAVRGSLMPRDTPVVPGGLQICCWDTSVPRENNNHCWGQSLPDTAQLLAGLQPFVLFFLHLLLLLILSLQWGRSQP